MTEEEYGLCIDNILHATNNKCFNDLQRIIAYARAEGYKEGVREQKENTSTPILASWKIGLMTKSKKT